MGKGIGIACIILGAICLLGAIGFVVYNQWEADGAEQVSNSLLAEVQLAMDQEAAPSQEEVLIPEVVEAGSTPEEMATVKADGYDCIGILSVPVLELELPVLADWSYTKLRKAPCHYFGTYYEKDFVIAAHNYKSHFGRLSELQAGDMVVFTDVNGTAYYYEVVLLETLPKEATQEMIASGFDLSLYTCTPGGGSRVTVRCNRMEI